jgi:hypothetical protein
MSKHIDARRRERQLGAVDAHVLFILANEDHAALDTGAHDVRLEHTTRGLGEVILQAEAFILIANASAMRLNDTSSMLASLGLVCHHDGIEHVASLARAKEGGPGQRRWVKRKGHRTRRCFRVTMPRRCIAGRPHVLQELPLGRDIAIDCARASRGVLTRSCV